MVIGDFKQHPPFNKTSPGEKCWFKLLAQMGVKLLKMLDILQSLVELTGILLSTSSTIFKITLRQVLLFSPLYR